MKVLNTAPLIDVADVVEMELIILRRMREYAMGEHAGVFKGSGFNFVGVRDWQPGDRPSSIDWPQSTFSNFQPMVAREFEQPSNATIMVVADRSASTLCGRNGESIGAGIARAIATIGLSGVFFQDAFGVMTFDEGFQHVSAVRPRIGRAHVIYCLDTYQHGRGVEVKHHEQISMTIGGHLRNASLVPVISDCLFEGVHDMLGELARLNTRHDVFLVLVESAFVFDLPALPAGWVETLDIETGRTSIMSRTEARRLAARVVAWQDEIAQHAKQLDLDVLRLGTSPEQNLHKLMEFVVERRLRKI